MRQIAHLRLLYGVVILLTTGLLIVGNAYRLKTQESERILVLLRAGQDINQHLRGQLALESKAREDAIKRLSEWEALYPQQAQAFQKTEGSK